MLSVVAALTMRKKFGSLLDRVAKNGEHITISRGGKVMATLIPASDYERLCQPGQRLERVQAALSRLEAWQRQNEDVLKKIGEKTSSEKMLRTMRDERYGD